MDPQSNLLQTQNVLLSDSRGGVGAPLRRGASTSSSIEKLPVDEKQSSSAAAQGVPADCKLKFPQDQPNSTVNPAKPSKTVKERLRVTIDHAKHEAKKFSLRGSAFCYLRDIALGLQILTSALITALSAVGVSGDRKTQTSTVVLGAVATVVASYLARIRGTGEPYLSYSRSDNLQSFVRQCESFVDDHGDEIDYSCEIDGFRKRLEELVGIRPENLKSPGQSPV